MIKKIKTLLHSLLNPCCTILSVCSQEKGLEINMGSATNIKKMREKKSLCKSMGGEIQSFYRPLAYVLCRYYDDDDDGDNERGETYCLVVVGNLYCQMSE